MECNKEEAVRAKRIAENKMQNWDFIGARKIVLKAQQLYPELENISQMLTVCEVHRSAADKVNGETDWYGILQVEMTADELLIKKQYRKLALLLHPDKNKFAGAEAAFKLIREAHMVLSDRGKRSLHDMKRSVNCRNVQTSQLPPQSNNSAYVRKQATVPTTDVNTTSSHFYGSNHHQHHRPVFSCSQTFWTICPNCSTRYQYYNSMLNRALHCQHCSTVFMAHDIGPQPVPPVSTSGFSQNSSRIHQQVFPGQHAANIPQQSYFGTSSTWSQGNVGGGSTITETSSRARVNYDVGAANPKGFGKASMERETHNGIKSEKDEVSKRKQRANASTVASQKKARKSVLEKSESEDIANEKDDQLVQPNGGTTGTCYPRRSARQRQNVSYNENGNDGDDENDVASPPGSKKLRMRGTSCNIDQSEKFSGGIANGVTIQTGETGRSDDKRDDRKKRHDPPTGSLLNESEPMNKSEMHDEGQEKEDKVEEEFKAGTSSKAGPSSEMFIYPDPEFYDFEKNRHPSQFAIDQIWAVYDDLDGMPRFYARIRKVNLPEFNLQFTWLEYDPVGEAEIAWSDEELPVACGNFKLGKTDCTQNLLMFSHLMTWNKGSKRNSYEIYPKKGEVWALFKGWNIGWSSNADRHGLYEFEVVEVLSDFAEGTEICIAHLYKIEGFLSLFSRAVDEGAPIKIPPAEILRFSHKVPSYRLTGNERKGVPSGSFELDAASLPNNFAEIFPSISLGSVKVERLDAGYVGPGSNSASVLETSAAGIVKDNVESDEKREREEENMTGNISSDEISGFRTWEHVQSEVVAPKVQVDEVQSTNAQDPICDVAAQKCNASPLESSKAEFYEYPETEFFNFEEGKSNDKFQKDQIWALYSDVDRYPNYYGLITAVELEDFKVHLMWLEACPLREERQWVVKGLPVGCGRFKVAQKYGVEIYSDTGAFSHLIEAKPSGRKNQYGIYPSKGEVWAVFKNWNAAWTLSDLDECEYDLVEVMEHTGPKLCVALLTKVAGYTSVFMPQRRGGEVVIMDIPMDEYLRFSHQIPAFQLTEEKGGKLRGFWELDTASVPAILFCAD